MKQFLYQVTDFALQVITMSYPLLRTSSLHMQHIKHLRTEENHGRNSK